MKQSLEQLVLDAIDLLKAHPQLRIGQAVSNLWQDVIEEHDPFYKDSNLKPFLLLHYKEREVKFAIKLLKLQKENNESS